MILIEAYKAIRDKTPFGFIALTMSIMVFGFTGWTTLSTNFAMNVAMLSEDQWGLAQTIREIPGFLAFTTVYLLLIFTEQRLAILSVIMLAIGIIATGFLPTAYGFFLTTFIMSVGFHYYYTVFISLPMQIFDADEYPIMRAKLRSIDSAVAALAFVIIFILVRFYQLDFLSLFLVVGIPTLLIALWCLKRFPPFRPAHPQTMRVFLRKRYMLYYLLQFLSGARRQIFVVFAALLLVQKFGYKVEAIALLFLINHLVTTFIAPMIGRVILRFGERQILQFEYIGLMGVFTLYAFVDNATLAAILYIVDNLFFSLAIALDGYFKRIAEDDEIAASAGTVFTINHIAAVFMPAFLGILWLTSPKLVFLIGTLLALLSFFASSFIPRHPTQRHAMLSLKDMLKPSI